ncbi:MAG: D-mannonate oxidoreductase [Armatimonadetes bacterium CG2_30_59_28]|nr:SDR family oxidoreductase [Armatimonadota bacterium]OIO93754.1 MAG: D-mannonate oxidoreductase [Armatimonadetes bacterium CG2_30_59_28]PIU67476.1 MAG: D-mannonate oxidoreductase [Armatimonadetes bacterium CG07_land_8_20_14_0_80_59_28]PIY43268.1 MAG: D-mannonate oxidoreductase [Armatimonadetes bacterium CG_4_10_14_3_um_filter_59_10]PJB62298.1 MAG: D-mannonate oxidoreductase [Armatimonadetes bacterium CG_4_9_14_3_um_filter_58_7]
MSLPDNLFDVSGKIAVITGGGGVLCGTMAKALSHRGVKSAVLDLREDAAQKVSDEINAAGGTAIGVACNALEKDSIEAAYETVKSKLGPADVLINGAGGNHPSATTSDKMALFDIPPEAVQFVFNLNFLGVFLPTQVIARDMADRGAGNIVNISSMNAFRPLTKIPAYSAAKAAVSNFTQWLATHMAQNYSKEIRVNGIAPGFFLTDQNRFLLTDEKTGDLTARGQTIIDHTPLGRFGESEDLVGTLLFLLSPAAAFVHGVVLPVDGGFSAFGGV